MSISRSVDPFSVFSIPFYGLSIGFSLKYFGKFALAKSFLRLHLECTENGEMVG